MSILDKAKNISLVLVLGVIWVTFISRFIQWLTDTTWYNPEVTNIPAYLFFGCLCAPIFEEILFRYPLSSVKLLPINSEATKLKITTSMVIILSLIFGLLHGHGWTSVLIQGVLGLGFCYVYLKNGYSLVSSIITHSLWNLLCLFYKF